MIEILDQKDRTARKRHHCDFCGEYIEKGEIYEWTKNIYCGEIYEWKSHKKCRYLCSELWDYADPDDYGMGKDLFMESLHDFCRCFVCLDCDKWSREYRECDEGESYCVDKAYDFLQTHELYRAERGIYGEVWKCRRRGKEDENN